eukprot:TRINITY_DN13809_c0_g1_i1.p1 TRINITY_DN13809_c0_g1~~TRINITY_DN13809_c0_g1_i1.p1  ORF type:complete len:234 (-),score=53.40 TRINITY_DN13809_c0_g1_i1:161-814(-)
MTTLAEDIAVFIEESKKHAPPAAVSKLTQEQQRMEREGVSKDLLKVGDQFPDGQLLDAHGKSTTLSEVRSGKPSVIVFYRGSWCPFCNLGLRSYQQNVLPTLQAKGINLIAISPQKPDHLVTSQEKNSLTFPVLSDVGNVIATKLGIFTRHSEEIVQFLGGMGVDIANTNEDGTDGLPMPTVAIVDSTGKIRFIDVHPNYSTRTEPQQILDAVSDIQ